MNTQKRSGIITQIHNLLEGDIFVTQDHIEGTVVMPPIVSSQPCPVFVDIDGQLASFPGDTMVGLITEVVQG